VFPNQIINRSLFGDNCFSDLFVIRFRIKIWLQ